MPRLHMNAHNLFFFDCETGGLDPVNHDMVEVAVILTDPTGKTVLDKYEARVFPKLPVGPKAAAINGYTTEKWASEAIDLGPAMIKMLTMARDSIFCSHNTPFDWGFFSAAMAQRGQSWPGDYHKIDTVALSTPLLKFGHVVNLKLETLAAHFGIPHTNAHRAMPDAHACHQLYLRLMDKYGVAFAA
jgi:DNA polymerase-3 subunit epsilon